MIKERSGHVRKARPDQLAVVMSMESAANYLCLDDPAFMAEFDFEMTYRQDVRSLSWCIARRACHHRIMLLWVPSCMLAADSCSAGE